MTLLDSEAVGILIDTYCIIFLCITIFSYKAPKSYTMVLVSYLINAHGLVTEINKNLGLCESLMIPTSKNKIKQ